MGVGRLLQFVFPHVAVATRFSSSSTACGVFDSNECATRKKPFVWAQVFGVGVALASLLHHHLLLLLGVVAALATVYLGIVHVI